MWSLKIFKVESIFVERVLIRLQVGVVAFMALKTL